MPERMKRDVAAARQLRAASTRIGRRRWRVGRLAPITQTAPAARSFRRSSSYRSLDRHALSPPRSQVRRRSRRRRRACARRGRSRDAHRRRRSRRQPRRDRDRASATESRVAVGIHPHEAKNAPPDVAGRFAPALERTAASSRSARRGSITTTTTARASAQARVLRAQLRLARETRASGRLPPARRVRRFHRRSCARNGPPGCAASSTASPARRNRRGPTSTSSASSWESAAS